MVGWHTRLNGHGFKVDSGFVMDREAGVLSELSGVARGQTRLSSQAEQTRLSHSVSFKEQLLLVS